MQEAENIIGLYDRHADHWARLRGDGLKEKKWLDAFLDLLTVKPLLLDLGCGSGLPIAKYLLRRGGMVTGVDASANLLKKAKKNLPQAQFILADMRQLDLEQKFDGIVAWDSFFHLIPEDQRRMFSTFQCHANQEAGLLFTSGPRYGEAVGDFAGEALYHASLDPDEYRSLLHENGFQLVDMVLEDPDCGGHTLWLAQYKPMPG